MKDGRITELFLARDPSALSEAQKAYGSYCMKLAANILGSRQDAEECVNDALLKVWNAIPPESPKHFGAFLARVTRNAALDRRKRDSRLKRSPAEAELVLSELAEIVSGGESPEDAVLERDLRAAIGDYLKALPERKRRLFIARYFRCASIEEISKETGSSPGAVKTELFRLRKELKNYLNERDYLL